MLSHETADAMASDEVRSVYQMFRRSSRYRVNPLPGALLGLSMRYVPAVEASHQSYDASVKDEIDEFPKLGPSRQHRSRRPASGSDALLRAFKEGPASLLLVD